MLQKLQSLRYRLMAAFGAIVLAAGMGLTFMSGSAAAAGYSYCNHNSSGAQACLNAWNGGPWVKTYSGDNVLNDGFSILAEGGSYVSLAFNTDIGNGCIGDINNDQNDTRTGLDTCSAGSNAGWGTHMTYGTCSSVLGHGSGYWFDDAHWGGSLIPYAYSNGSNFILNGNDTYYSDWGCFTPEHQIGS